LHERLEQFIDALHRFLSRVAPCNCFFDLRTVRLICSAPIFMFVVLDNDFEYVAFQRVPPVFMLTPWQKRSNPARSLLCQTPRRPAGDYIEPDPEPIKILRVNIDLNQQQAPNTGMTQI